MSSVVIRVEKLSKQYRLSQVGSRTLSHDINRWWHSIRGKENPYIKIGETNDRTKKSKSDYVWALQNINFEVKQGEVLGIIGRNGAGKSTLLKILSRTTSPTTGTVKLKGRVASLLEVGTGFHPELSGRDNIFLNGAILGMTKNEIQSKFDEILDFAGVERYIDTPVKRYSSGMYVRLAFAVAAHLEPDILIVDEVLAVGDVEFQKKCLGKMKDVSVKDGRTIIYVSHNMKSLTELCDNSILIKNGQLELSGLTIEVVRNYYSDALNNQNFKKYSDLFNGFDHIIEVNNLVINDQESGVFNISDGKIDIRFTGLLRERCKLSIEARLYDDNEMPLFFFSPGHQESSQYIDVGNFVLCAKIILPIGMTRSNLKLKLFLTEPGKKVYGETITFLNCFHNGFKTALGYTFEYEKGAGILFIS